MSVIAEFNITCNTSYGTNVFITGNTYILGCWKKFIPLKCINYPRWIIKDIELPYDYDLEFKFVKIDSNGVQEWETHIDNRKIALRQQYRARIFTTFGSNDMSVNFHDEFPVSNKPSMHSVIISKFYERVATQKSVFEKYDCSFAAYKNAPYKCALCTCAYKQSYVYGCFKCYRLFCAFHIIKHLQASMMLNDCDCATSKVNAHDILFLPHKHVKMMGLYLLSCLVKFKCEKTEHSRIPFYIFLRFANTRSIS